MPITELLMLIGVLAIAFAALAAIPRLIGLRRRRDTRAPMMREEWPR